MTQMLCEQIIEKGEDSYLFLEYIKSHGFDPNNYSYILELFQSPRASISQYLRKYKQFLLSNYVNYNELNELQIRGGCGYFTPTEIVIPKTLKNDDIFLHNKTLSHNHKINYNVPELNDFDVIIGNGMTKNIMDLYRYSQDIYIGCCVDTSIKGQKEILSIYKKIFSVYQLKSNNQYVFEHDTLKDEGKELCLIKKK